MSRGEAMKPQPFIHMRSNAVSPTIVEGLVSLFPGTDWYRFGGVAIQADPCDDCGGSGDVPLTGSAAEVALAEQILGGSAVEDCPKCHGLGVIPRHGKIRLVSSEGDGPPTGMLAAVVPPGLVLVVPIEGDE